MRDFHFQIDLPVRNEWANVDLMRSSVQNCFIAMFSDIEGCQDLAMVTGELLENAVKYGDWAPGATFRLSIWGENGVATVCVENPVAPGNKALADLHATIAWINSFPSAEDAYREKLLEIAGNLQRGSSGLGLVRIAYEGGCKLAAEAKNGILRVTAVRPLALPAALAA
jgi:hypothetical protein